MRYLKSFIHSITQPSVTIVIAAYRRVDVLNRTLQSIYRQTYKNWRVLIVADHCDSNFFKGLDLSHPNVNAINLPVRIGHQYGPNSVGIELADSEYIAFLNHDDYWLEDHLEIALKSLKKGKSNLFLGKSAFCHHKNQLEACMARKRVVFSETNFPEMYWRAFIGPNWLFEPASSWVVSTKLAKKVGYWNAPDKISFTPVMDWLQRCFINQASVSFSTEVTCLKFNLHIPTPKSVNSYDGDGLCADQVKFIMGMGKDEIRKILAEDLQSYSEFSLTNREHMLTQEDESQVKQNFEGYVSGQMQLGNRVNATEALRNNAINTIKQRTGEDFDSFIAVEELLQLLSEIEQ